MNKVSPILDHSVIIKAKGGRSKTLSQGTYGGTFSFYISPSPTHQQELLLSEPLSAESVPYSKSVCVVCVCEREREKWRQGGNERGRDEWREQRKTIRRGKGKRITVQNRIICCILAFLVEKYRRECIRHTRNKQKTDFIIRNSQPDRMIT